MLSLKAAPKRSCFTQLFVLAILLSTAKAMFGFGSSKSPKSSMKPTVPHNEFGRRPDHKEVSRRGYVEFADMDQMIPARDLCSWLRHKVRGPQTEPMKNVTRRHYPKRLIQLPQEAVDNLIKEYGSAGAVKQM